jgi:hypothetical protein
LFNQKVVFVVGAGASREYNFPLGSHLKDRIAADVRFRFEYGSQMKSGSPELLDHIRRHVKGDNVRTNEYTRAANLLAWISEGANKSWCSPAGEKTGPGKAAAGRPLASVA